MSGLFCIADLLEMVRRKKFLHLWILTPFIYIPIINVKGIETRKNPKVKKKVFNLTSKR